MTIPKRYYKANGVHPSARTVAELKALLAELPDSLPLNDSWGNAPKLIVYNHGKPDMNLQLVDAE